MDVQSGQPQHSTSLIRGGIPYEVLAFVCFDSDGFDLDGNLGHKVKVAQASKGQERTGPSRRGRGDHE